MTQAWGRLKSLMLKRPNHEFSREMIVIIFYAGVPQHDRETLDSSSGGCYNNKDVNSRWGLIERISRDAEDWEMTKVKNKL